MRVRLLRGLLLCLACLPGWAPVVHADATLRSNLHARVRSTHQPLPYSSSTRFDTADALAQIDRTNPGTTVVRLVYGGSLPVNSFGAATGWNREHLWPNSLGIDDRLPAYSDLHNLRPCDANVNSARGNKWYDTSTPADPGFTRPAHAEAALCTTDRDSWMPAPDERGDIARALFYMDVRYEGTASEPDLQLVEDTRLITATGTRMGRLSTLLRWHAEDPPDDAERSRNSAVAQLQGNRNPFIDDPGLASALYLPRIQIQAGQDQPAVSWSSDLPLQLESAPSPLGPWSRVAAPAEVETDTPARFFRLVLSP